MIFPSFIAVNPLTNNVVVSQLTDQGENINVQKISFGGVEGGILIDTEKERHKEEIHREQVERVCV